MNSNYTDPAFPVFPDTGSGHGTAFRGLTKLEQVSAMILAGRCARNAVLVTSDVMAAVTLAEALLDECAKRTK